MCNQSPHGTSFWSFLLSVDQDIADRARREACPCGGRLHCANFPRKPRGCPDGLPEGYSARLSFCCDRDGCRKRVTPPSVRFLGRKVYLAAIVVLTAAMRQGPTPRRVRELSRLVGADRATIFRWQGFWQEQFPRTPFWKVARGRLVSTIAAAVLPRSLLDAFVRPDNPGEGLVNLLRFLAPFAILGNPKNQDLALIVRDPQKMHRRCC